MDCDQCDHQRDCEMKRSAALFNAQFERCVETGEPDWKPDSHFNIEEAGQMSKEGVEKAKDKVREMTAPSGKQKVGQKGVCRNCHRLGVTIVSDGLDWYCYNAGKGKTGEEREKALERAAEKIQGDGLRRGWTRKHKEPEQEPVKDSEALDKLKATCSKCGESKIIVHKDGRCLDCCKELLEHIAKEVAQEKQKGNSPEVVLVFKEAKDQELLKTVWEMAAVQRRTVEQQILWMIEQAGVAA